MRELEKRGGIPTPVPGPGPNLPREPPPELLLRRVMTLRSGAHGGFHHVGTLWAATG